MLLRLTQSLFTIGALLAFTSTVKSQPGINLIDVFDVDAGCNNYRTGQDWADLDGYFLEAQAIVNAAVWGFHTYADRPDVRQVAKSFFNIDVDPQTLQPTDQDGQDKLASINDWFNSLASFVNGQPPRPYVKLFCDTAWFQGPTTQLYNAQGDPIAGTIPSAYPQEPDLATGDLVPYWAAQFKQYWFLEKSIIEKLGEPNTWPDKMDAVTVELSGGTKVLTISVPKYIQDDLMNDKVPIQDAKVGELLSTFEAKSTTLIHELVHITQGNDGTPDQESYEFAGFDPETKSPIYTEEQKLADTPEECMGLADNRQAQPHRNPQNIAWAALAIYLHDKTGYEWASGSAIAPIQ